MQQFKIRASAAGQIMGAKGIGKTGETFVEMWLKSQLYNRKVEIRSKYLAKGNTVEAESIFFIGRKLGLNCLKNEQFFEDEYFTGTPDIITDDFVLDVKNSWDWTTFPLNSSEIPNKDYIYQLQIYMHLTGKKKAKLIYILSDTPENLIEKEAWYKCKELGMEELDYDIYENCRKNMTYSDVPAHLKFRVFDLNYEPVIIETLQNRVIECRKYLERF
jgi:hypothetical protein